MDLYFAPMACSLASRIAAYEGAVPLAFHRVQLATKTGADGTDFKAISAKGQVPALRLDDGSVLTENPAVLQFIADQSPASGLAPPAGVRARYELQSWLGYVGSELHKQILWTTFAPDTPPEAKAHVRTLVPAKLAHIDGHLTGRSFLLGETFTVADAYLLWALLLFQRIGVDFTGFADVLAYIDRCMSREAVRRAIADESALLAA